MGFEIPCKKCNRYESDHEIGVEGMVKENENPHERFSGAQMSLADCIAQVPLDKKPFIAGSYVPKFPKLHARLAREDAGYGKPPVELPGHGEW